MSLVYNKKLSPNTKLFCDSENHPNSHAASYFIIYNGVSSIY